MMGEPMPWGTLLLAMWPLWVAYAVLLVLWLTPHMLAWMDWLRDQSWYSRWAVPFNRWANNRLP